GDKYFVDPADWSGSVEVGRRLALIDLERCSNDLHIETLPPFPVIGIGEPSHPLASRLDTIIEAPVDVAMLIRQIELAPRAAAITVQLLRALDGAPVDRALTMESLTYGLLQGSEEYRTWLTSRTSRSRSDAG